MNILYCNLIDIKTDINYLINNFNENNIIIIHNKFNNIYKLLNILPNEFDNYADITNNNLCILYNTKKLKLFNFDNNENYQILFFGTIGFSDEVSNNNIIIINMIIYNNILFIKILLSIKNIKNYKIILISNFNKYKSTKINYLLYKNFNFTIMNKIYDNIYVNMNNIKSIKYLNDNITYYELLFPTITD